MYYRCTSWKLSLSLDSPKKCLGLEPKWHWPLWNSKTTHPTQSCLHPNDGASWGLWEWTLFKHHQRLQLQSWSLFESIWKQRCCPWYAESATTEMALQLCCSSKKRQIKKRTHSQVLSDFQTGTKRGSRSESLSRRALEGCGPGSFLKFLQQNPFFVLTGPLNRDKRIAAIPSRLQHEV